MRCTATTRHAMTRRDDDRRKKNPRAAKARAWSTANHFLRKHFSRAGAEFWAARSSGRDPVGLSFTGLGQVEAGPAFGAAVQLRLQVQGARGWCLSKVPPWSVRAVVTRGRVWATTAMAMAIGWRHPGGQMDRWPSFVRSCCSIWAQERTCDGGLAAKITASPGASGASNRLVGPADCTRGHAVRNGGHLHGYAWHLQVDGPCPVLQGLAERRQVLFSQQGGKEGGSKMQIPRPPIRGALSHQRSAKQQL